MKRRWIAEDGTEHENKQAAEAHDATTRLAAWSNKNDLPEDWVDTIVANAVEVITLLKPFVPPQRRKRRTKLEAAA